MKQKDLEVLIKAYLQNHAKKNLSHKQVIKRLGIRDKKTKNAAKAFLLSLGTNKTRQQTKSPLAGQTINGTVDYVNPRFAFIVSETLAEDVYVKTENLKQALDDDLVKVVLFPKMNKGRSEGKVVEILNRYRDEFVGRVETSTGYAFVVPDFKKMHHDIFVPLAKLKNAKKNDKVIVRIKQWPSANKNPEGEVIRVLGPAGENEAEINSIMAEFGLPFKFPDDVLKEAQNISDQISDKEIGARRDLRTLTTLTIDPEDAKDFDDALSFRKLEHGQYEIGVHIADVTHYVDAKSELDREADTRGTSVYLVDRTIPMLPEKLSNELCSLRPNEDKLTFSAIFILDENARVLEEWFGRTIIHSNRRFTYEEAQERIETHEGDFANELITLNELALKLRLERFMRGAINFETVEVKFELDEEKRPIAIKPKERKDAHKLIEEFMLLANKKVAEFIYKQRQGNNRNTFVYRVHDNPDPDKLEAFSTFAGKFGHRLNLREEGISKSINSLVDAIEGKPEQNVLQTLAIRTMAKAVYTTEEKGHFGLAFYHYTHFTSPIRRYPDVMVHRLLQHYLDNGSPVNKADYEKKCQHASEMEKRAADAERASIKYKQVEFMQKMLGEEFDGIVSGVTEWGIYVEITQTRCEGMVKLADLDDDYYQYDEDNFRVVGNNTGKTITLGDNVRVIIARTDINRRLIDLDLVAP